MKKNILYYGDNLDILRRYVADESVDLIYLDPPFNSKATYNVLFGEQNGTRSAAQIKAFEDTWRWDTAALAAYEETLAQGGRVAQTLKAFHEMLGQSNMMAYLAMMAPRLVELRRVLKGTGSIYLHCDPTASHYLKVLMDAIFGAQNFRNEIVWKRTSAHGSARRWGPVHDTLLFYTKGPEYTWNKCFQAYDERYLRTFYRFVDEKGRYQLDNLTGAGTSRGDSGQPWRGVDPTASGRHWAIPSDVLRSVCGDKDVDTLTTQEKLDILDANGLIYWPSKGKMPRLKRYLDESAGVPIQDIVTDIPPISSQAAERLGYPTQKPEALLERIIRASSNEGDLVLDPFCGCGTTIVVAERLKRRWVGIDITHLAINLMKRRLEDTFGEAIKGTYEVNGEPVTVSEARALAQSDAHQFQWWALSLVGAGPAEKRKGADQGVDGRLYFRDEAKGKTKQVILSVKSGHVGPRDVRDLRGVVEREGAEIGVLLTLQEPTPAMRAEAASAGTYRSPGWNTEHPRLQILTIREILEEGKGIDMPPPSQVSTTFKRAPRARGDRAAQSELDLPAGS